MHIENCSRFIEEKTTCKLLERNIIAQNKKHLIFSLNLDKVNEAQLHEREKVQSDKIKGVTEMHDALAKQMEERREQHQKQLALLRDEITQKQNTIEQMRE